MAASARQMRPVMLELGGKSPSIVLGDVDVDALVPTLRSAILWNAGQTCDAQSRILVDRAVHADLVEAPAADFGTVTVGAALEDHDVGPLVSEVQHARVSAHVDAARHAGGAKLVVGGGRPDGLDQGWFFEPTTFDVTDPSSPIATDEIFGPVLSIVPSRSATRTRRCASRTASATTSPPPSGQRTSTAPSDSRARSAPARFTSTAGASAPAWSSPSAASAKAASVARRACARSTSTPRCGRRRSGWPQRRSGAQARRRSSTPAPA